MNAFPNKHIGAFGGLGLICLIVITRDPRLVMYYTPSEERQRLSGPIRIPHAHPHALSGLGLEEKLLERAVSKGQIQIRPGDAGRLVRREPRT